MSAPRHALVWLLGALATAGAAGCFSERVTGDAQPPSGAECRVPLDSTTAGAVFVAIRDYAFIPAQVRVKAGQSVVWVNCDPPALADPHTSTSDVSVWDSPLLSPGDIYVRRFDTVGSFPYHCEPHPFMQAGVVVE